MLVLNDEIEYNIQEKFDIIAEARKIHKINRQRKIIDKTRQNYNKIAKRLLIKDKILPIDIATSKSTYYVYKAAVVSYLMDVISDTLPQMDNLRKSDQTRWLSEIENLKLYLGFLKAVGVDQDKHNLSKSKNGYYQSEWSKKAESGVVRAKKSKAIRLKTLPRDWSQKIFDYAVKTNSKHVLAIATLSISGCRPKELEGGIELTLNSNHSITVKINGVKTHSGQYGQEFRRFDVKSSSSEYIHLRSELIKTARNLTVTADPGALCDKISYISKKTMPLLKENVSAYCFRHRFSADLHHAGLDTESIAMALGHRNDQSQQYYSRAYRTGSTGFSITNINTAQKVNQKNLTRMYSKKETALTPS